MPAILRALIIIISNRKKGMDRTTFPLSLSFFSQFHTQTARPYKKEGEEDNRIVEFSHLLVLVFDARKTSTDVLLAAK